MRAALVIMLLSAFPDPATSARVQLHHAHAGPENDLTPKLLPELLRDKWCTDSEAQLTCKGPSAVIQVQAAFYSTRVTEDCDIDVDKQNGPESCNANATQMVYGACENKAQCTIAPASFSVCQKHPFSFIRITWECVNGTTVVAMTDEEWKLLESEEAERSAAKKAEADRLDREEAHLAAAKKEADRLATEAAVKKAEADQLKAEMKPHQDNFTSDFKARIKTSKEWWSGTDDNVHIQLLGEDGPSGWQQIDKWWHDYFERNSSAWYSFRSKNKMYPKKVCLKKDGSDGWRPTEVEIYSSSNQFYGKNTTWGFIDDHNEHCRDI